MCHLIDTVDRVSVFTREQNQSPDGVSAEDIEIGKEIEIETVVRGRPLRSLEVKQKERMFSAANN